MNTIPFRNVSLFSPRVNFNDHLNMTIDPGPRVNFNDNLNMTIDPVFLNSYP